MPTHTRFRVGPTRLVGTGRQGPARALGAALTPAGGVTYFQDGFESGTLTSPTVALPGWAWGETNIDGGYILAPSTLRAYSGAYSLRFQFKPGPYPDDSWAEQRFWMGGNLTENYVRFQVYIPSNYAHRNTPSSDNNKFWRQWCTTYSQTELGSSLVATNNADPLAGSDLILERCDFYHPMGPDGMPTVVGFIAPADFGTWIDVQMYFKLGADVGGAGARMIVWKNGTQVADTGAFVNDPGAWPNRFTAGYMLGYSNSGFDSLTELYIDNVTFSDASAY